MMAALQNMLQRVKIVQSTAPVAGGRVLLQHSGLDEDARDQVEALHPFGWAAAPIGGADAIEMQIGGIASHKVVIGGDHTADAVTDLLPGEAGLSRGGQQAIARTSGYEIITPLLRWGFNRSGLKRLVQEEFMALFNEHTHKYVPGSGSVTDSQPPTQQMNATHLTGGS